MAEPASIRYKNPGAQWPGPVSKKFGSTKHVVLKDGQNNKIAVFDTFEAGAAAQFYLWSTRYTGMTLEDAIKKWSGHNSSKSYADHMKKKVGISMSDLMTKKYLAGPDGWKFMKAQAQWEAGKPYPMTDEQWKAGQELAFGKSGTLAALMPTKGQVIAGTRAVGGVVVGGGTLAVQATTAVTETPGVTVENVKTWTDNAGQVAGSVKTVVEWVPEGTFAKIMKFVASPGFLAFALAVVLIAWALSYYLRRNEGPK